MKRWIGLLVGFLLAGGCGDDGGGNVNGDTNQLFDSLCDTAFRCCSRGEVDDMLGPFVDEENCRDRLSQSAHVRSGLVLYSLPLEEYGFVLPNVSLLERAVKEDRARLVGGAVNDCLKFLGDIPCNSTDEEEEVDGCEPREASIEGLCDLDLLIEGKVGEGGACTSSNPSFECRDGFTCVQVSSLGTDGVCVEASKVGEFCYFDSECDEDLFCNVFDGKCEALHTEGQPCEFVDPDDSNPDPRPISQGGDVVIQCESHLSCDPIFDLCVPDCVQGAPCFGDEQCNVDDGLQCLVVGSFGRCDVQRGVGLPCANDLTCSEGLFCDINPANPGERICFSAQANGEDCSRDEQCSSDYCDSGFTNQCAPKVANGSECPSRNGDQCTSGYCEIRSVDEIDFVDIFPFGSCSADDDCPATSTCDTTLTNRCVPLCRARAADGVACVLNEECSSENCIGVRQGDEPGQCQTIPLLDGQNCSSGFQCESEFCNQLNGLCQTLPLSNGEFCSSDVYCDSNVCDGGLCVPGLSAGADCSSERCASALYCDNTVVPRLCVAKREAGEQCSSSLECHGNCQQIYGRFRCDTTPGVDANICDGQ